MPTASLFLAGCVACSLLAAFAPSTSSPGGDARLDIDRGETYLIQALFDGETSEALTYRLAVVREGAAGRSSSSQSGAFESEAQKTSVLSTARVNVAPGDRFTATLTVMRGDEVVSEANVEETVR